MRRTCYLATLVCLVSFGLPIAASATNLLDVYQQALQSDPTFLSAQAEHLANGEALPQSRANLLPNISATANTAFNRLNSPDTISSETGTIGSSPISRFNSKGYLVTLTQPLIDFTNWLQVSEASNTVKAADATYAAAAQDLIIRVANAYFNVLLAQDNLRFITAEKASTAKQLQQVQAGYRVGVDTITSLNEARASYDAIVAQEISAQNQLTDSKEQLTEITGQSYAELSPLKADLPLLPPRPLDMTQWVAAASSNNLDLQAAHYQMLAARDNIKVNYGNHLPTLSAVGSYDYSRNSPETGIQGTSQLSSVGLQVNVPIFEGGLVNSQVRQAQDNYVKASEDMEAAHRAAIANTRQEFDDVLADISKIQADKQAIVSALSSLTSTETAYRVGTRTIIDVLGTQQTFYQAQYNYAADQYAYIMDTLKLRQQTGNLTNIDVAMVNAWLATNPATKQ